VLTIQRQVIGEFVDQPASDETDVGTAGLDHTGGRAGTGDGLGLFDLDHRAPVLEHDVAAGALGQSVALLVTDDLEGVRSQPLGFGRGQFDHFDGTRVSSKKGTLSSPVSGLFVAAHRVWAATGRAGGTGASPGSMSSPRLIGPLPPSTMRRSLF